MRGCPQPSESEVCKSMTARRHDFLLRLALKASALLLATWPLALAAFPAQAGQSLAAMQAGPASVADLAEGLLDAVVNISISQNVKDDEGSPVPQVQDGSPFQDLFDDYYKGDGKDGGNSHTVTSLGSGFVIDPAGFIVTNNHVIEGADDIEVIFAKGNKLKAKLIGTDPKTDLSLLKVESKVPLKSVKFGDSARMRIGDWVMAIGNPFGLGGSVTVGIISARGRNINAGPYDNFIQTDAAINKGNSGGPLFNMQGEVIGINTAIISPSGGSIGIGFSVPSEIAVNVVDQLKQFGETRRGWLGVRVQPVTDDIAESLGMDGARGALVSGLVKGGPVENGPIKTGDVIVSFDGKPIGEMRDLLRIVAESPMDKQVEVGVIRDGKPLTLSVKLGRLEDQPDQPVTADPQSKLDGGDEPAQPDANSAPKPDDPAGNATVDVLGMTLSTLDEKMRSDYGIDKDVKGALITAIADGSPALSKGLEEGDVIIEVAQSAVSDGKAVADKIAELKQQGRRNALMLVASPNGDLRTVALSLE